MSYRTSVIAASAAVLAILCCFITRRVGTVEAQSASNGPSPLCSLPPAGGPPGCLHARSPMVKKLIRIRHSLENRQDGF